MNQLNICVASHFHVFYVFVSVNDVKYFNTPLLALKHSIWSWNLCLFDADNVNTCTCTSLKRS